MEKGCGFSIYSSAARVGAIHPEDQTLFSVALTILGCSGELSAREGRAGGGGEEAAQLALTSYLTLTLCCVNPHTNAEIGLSTRGSHA